MDRKRKEKGRESGHSYFLERKEHVSIEGRGNVLIRNTQTQVRELYRRHVTIEPEERSSSQGDVRILETSRQVRALNKKIEDEIDKLKHFRDAFLQEKETRNVKQAKKLRSEPKETPAISHKETPIATSQPEAKSVKFSSPNSDSSMPYFRTVHVASIPISGAVKNPDPNVTIPKQSPPSPQKHTRMGGGCTFGYNECMSMPCSVYQCDYDPSPAIACQCATYHCYPGNCRCYEYHAPMSVPYSPNPCYQYPKGAVYHQQVPSYCACPCSTSAARRTTDLNTEEFCRGLSPSPRATGRRTRTPSPSSKRNKKKVPSQYPTTTPRNDKKIIKVSLKKPQTRKTKKQSTKPAEEKAAKPNSDGDYADQEKMRLHRQYMEMYKQEHEKTAKKDSSPNNSDLDTHPTYTKLVTETPELKSSSKDSGIKPEPQTFAEITEDQQEELDVKQSQSLQDSASAEEDALENPPPTKEQQPMDSHSRQPDRRRVKIQDTFQKCTVSVKRQAVQGSLGLCQAAEVEQECVQYAVCASGPDIAPNRSISSQEELSTSNQSFHQSRYQSCDLSCHQSCHQSCQTSLGKSMTDFGYQISRKNTPTQTDLLAGAPQRDLRNDATWNKDHSSAIGRLLRKQMSSKEQEGSSETTTECVCVTQTIENIEVTFAAERPAMERKHQSEPYIRSMSAVFGHDDTLTSTPGPQSVSLEGPSTTKKRQIHFSSPRTSGTEELFSFPEHTQLSVMSESPRETGREGKNLSRWTLNRSEDDSPAFNRTFNRSEESSPNFSLQLDSPQRQAHSSTSASYRTFNRSEERSSDLSLRLDSPSKQVYNSSDASYRTFNRSEDEGSSPNFSLQMDSPTRQNSSSPFASSRNRNSPDFTLQHEYNKDLDSRSHLTATKSILSEKRTRSVKFQDESGIRRRMNKSKSSRSAIDWERSLSTDGDVECATSLDNLCEECLRDDSSHLIDSCRSSSTAEFTCNESNYEEDYLSCTESRTEHLPPFRGCPCMRNHYLTLAALSRPLSRYAQ
ncbi:hypothetical protein ACLKA6_011251 [Drosophila palustris]